MPLNKILLSSLFVCILNSVLAQSPTSQALNSYHYLNDKYTGDYIKQIAFPIGGIGAGMFCLEGTGAISHMSVRNNPQIFNEPTMFAAINIKGLKDGTKVLEGPVPDRKKYGMRSAGVGAPGSDWGLPRFQYSEFLAKFPFGIVTLKDKSLPLEVVITGWSPFIPGDENNSSLPLGALEYKFKNTSNKTQDYTFSYNSTNFMTIPQSPYQYDSSIGKNYIDAIPKGFVLSQEGSGTRQDFNGDFAIFTDEVSTSINYSWFRGGWFDPLTMIWNSLLDGKISSTSTVEKDAPGASLFIPFKLKPGEEKLIRVYMAWYVPDTKWRFGQQSTKNSDTTVDVQPRELSSEFYKPWYSSKFKNIKEVSDFWLKNYDTLRKNTNLFTNAFYNSSLPPEVIEAVSANLTILKTPTVLRQFDGRFWAWEGCGDDFGSCHGSCTHVWNYAQALSHLFPHLEKSLRNTEFGENQNSFGHQTFRSALPIQPVGHNFYAAADGQLGGIMKTYREWRINGDSIWLRSIFSKVKKSLDYCIDTWDPRHTGTLEEPHHNTYDIEFWGPDPMCSSFYLGALKAFSIIEDYLGEDSKFYRDLFNKGKITFESQLFNGDYFYQKTKWIGLSAKDPIEVAKQIDGKDYSEDALKLIEKEGPKYQYGGGCLSDGLVGEWMARVCGLSNVIDPAKVKKHLVSVYKYNYKVDLSNHSNPQRATYAMGQDGGLLLCSWPNGGKLSLPFIYSDEVWTGVEYEVASNLIFNGQIKEGLNIVKTCRKRYDGKVRNPFDEYECGHWYARAMSSYSLLEALTGVRFDAVDSTLFVGSKVGNFTSFLSTNTGFGNVIFKDGKVNVDVVYGNIPIRKIIIN
ncbi:GH116 family glycosyl hydrolase [Chitinophaga sancti]|uniref:GH116 family glycosyl hydrolase n=1 Tax=Chitinophaga sancti TaxID=1004 RepID=A0A1K1S3G0_9BACT|nr:GH116 family glycosyl hydrolase [Chitinophaga sancti]WQD59637.1 GH116 family glycosyl hydrolase [Chitinophaga sancti]WQG88232.1 GH116 family glycosyl hydrolase [Chitinophaga sancti]SFW78557.1 Uncharacterized protein, contains GBA2_N and DUF608 domains [Chitinophaga sancti]